MFRNLLTWVSIIGILSCAPGDKAASSPSDQTPGPQPSPAPGPTPAPPPVQATTNPLNLPEDTGPTKDADATGWKFLTSAQGVPSRVFGVSADEGGNLWVAGGAEGIAVRRAGETKFRHFGTPFPAISIVGGAAGTAYVGYQGLDGCDMAWDLGGPPSIYKSGDADRVWLSGEGLERSHYDISSGPGVVSAEPRGREKLCTIVRILFDPTTHSVWFGGNHGVAWGDPDSSRVVEHTHPAINGYQPNAQTGELHYTLLSGIYYGLAVDPNGNLWLGAHERSALLKAGVDALHFWDGDKEVQKNKIDVWPDQVPQDPRPDQAVWDDTYGFAPLTSGLTWVGSLHNGLAVLDASGHPTAFFKKSLITSGVTAMHADPLDESVWAGHAGSGGVGGITRLRDNVWVHYGKSALGRFASSRVYDIQTVPAKDGQPRQVLVGFYLSGIGIYSGD